MKIKQRQNGGWCMEHNGVEAPYAVTPVGQDKFNVYDDDDLSEPIARRADAETCERLALAHFATMGKGQDQAEKKPDTMKVIVVDRHLQSQLWGNGYRSIHEVIREIEVSTKCPVCGGPRGTPALRRFCEDGEWYDVHVWQNPCGHLDSYSNLLLEAGAHNAQDRDPPVPFGRLEDRMEGKAVET